MHTYTQPGLGLTFVNPFVSIDDAADTMADLQQLVETELNGTFLLQHETSYLSFYQQFVAPTTLVRPPCHPNPFRHPLTR